MEEERVVGSRVFHKPMHGSEKILFCRLAHGILLVISEDNHILPLIPKTVDEICRHVLHIVDTTTQLTALTEVVDANQ